MTTAIIPFAFGDNLVRVITDEKGDPWFVAKDVARALGYSGESNPARLLQAIPEEWKGVKRIHTLGGTQEVWLFSEQGLYFFLGRSDKPGAFPFQKWMAGDVMPTLRKTGTYTVPTPKPEIPEPPQPKAIESAPERLPREMPDMELPESALNLRPSMRMRLWQDALQSARLEGAGIAYAVDCFVKLCTVMAKQPKPKESPFRDEVKQFIATRCRFTPGTNTRASDLYESFRGWRRKHGKGHMPSQKIFGEAMGLHYEKYQSNGQWYRDVSLVNSPAS